MSMVFGRLAMVAAIAGLCIGTSAMAEENTPVRLNSEGVIVGNTFAMDGEQQIPQAASVSLVQNGKMIHSVVADESGQFSFADVSPGVYSLVASAGTYVGTMTIAVESPEAGAVEPASAAVVQPAPVATPVAPAPLAVQMSDYIGGNSGGAVFNSPMASYSPGCTTCSGGGGGIGRTGIGGSSRLRRFLIIGGIVGGVVGGTAGRASPAE